MTTSNFRFLNDEYPNLARLGALAERNVFDDPSTSLTKLRILSSCLGWKFRTGNFGFSWYGINK